MNIFLFAILPFLIVLVLMPVLAVVAWKMLDSVFWFIEGGFRDLVSRKSYSSGTPTREALRMEKREALREALESWDKEFYSIQGLNPPIKGHLTGHYNVAIGTNPKIFHI